MVRVSDWDALRHLLAAARAGSLSGGARALRVDPATIGRKVAALETSLGTKLLSRGSGGRLTPTEAGRQLLAAAARAEEALAEVERGVKAETDDPAGVVRLTTIDFVAEAYLAPALPRLRQRHPGIVLDLVTTPQLLDLGRDADVAVRVLRPRHGSVVSRKAGSLAVAPYVAPRLLRGRRPQDPPEDLDVLALGEHFFRHGQNAWIDRIPGARVVLHTTSIGMLVGAAQAGVGAALVPVGLAERAGLVRLEALPATSWSIWVASHQDFAKSPRVQAVWAFVADAFAAAART